MDLDADGSVDADGDAEREQTVDADGDADADGEADDPSNGPSRVGTPAKPAPPKVDGVSTPARAAALAGARPATPGSASRTRQAQTDIQRAQASHAAAAMHIQNLIALRAPVFELGVDATLVDPRALSNVDDASIALSLSALFPDLPVYSDFLLASDPQMDKRIEDSSAWSGRLSHVTKLLESKPLLVSTVQPGRTRTTKGWEPATSVYLDDSKEMVDPREIVPNTSSGECHLLLERTTIDRANLRLSQSSSLAPSPSPRTAPPNLSSSPPRSPTPTFAPPRSTGLPRRTLASSRSSSSTAPTGTSLPRSSTRR